MRGVGLLLPFQRDGRGSFATGRDAELWGSAIALVLLTKGDTPQGVGELPWRTSFGAGLDRLRFRTMNLKNRELARTLVSDALRRWMPEVEVVDVEPGADNAQQRLTLAIFWRWRDDTSPQVNRATIPL